MTNEALKTVVTRKGYTSTPQSQKADSRQVKNSGGGYGFEISDLKQIERFLILGANDSFYRSGNDLAKENAGTLIRFIEGGEDNHNTLVDRIVAISTEGRAPKQQPGLFALAVASSYGTDAGKRYALSKLTSVARTGTTLFEFAGYVQQFRAWGNPLRKAVTSWYSERPVDKLAAQVVKYKNRAGFTHRDIFRLAHVKGVDHTVGSYVLGNEFEFDMAPAIIQDEVLIRSAKNLQTVVTILENGNLTWESVPTEYLNEKKVWDTLLDQGNVPLGALLRQLPRLTQIGVIAPLADRTYEIASRLTDQEALVKARIHPINVLVALKTYAGGRSLQGAGTWNPVQDIVDALDEAFYLAFKAVVSSNKKFMIGVDVSGSMTWGHCAGVPLKPCEAAAAMALVVANTEPKTYIKGFSRDVIDLPISKNDSLDDALRKTSHLAFGATNPAALIQNATQNKIDVDVFLIISDNEGNYGTQHAHEALNEYRRKINPNAKLVSLDTEPSRYSIGDVDDPGTLMLAGFDTASPQIVSAFASL